MKQTTVVIDMKDYEPVMPAEALQALFKCSNGNVCMQTKLGKKGWERSLLCEDCGRRQSVEALIILEKDEEAAFARILNFCSQHKHEGFLIREKTDGFETVSTDSGRRIKEV